MSRRNAKAELERASKRAAQNIRKQKQAMSSYLSEDANFGSFSSNLAVMGLKLRDIPGDGNCLFRALGDQLDGNSENHLHHREETVRYMIKNQSDFEPFVEDDVPFETHVSNLGCPGTYAGNDAIVAFARNHGVNVVIHQLNAQPWTVKGSDQPTCRQLHISYHNGDHYSSVRKITDNSRGPANVRLSSKLEHKESESSGHRKGGRRRTDSATDRETSKVKKISQVTQCMEFDLIKKLLRETGNDEEKTIGLIFQSYEDEDSASDTSHDKASNINYRTSKNPLWSKDGTGSRIFGNAPNTSHSTAKPNRTNGPKKLSNKKRQELAKRERKNRNSARKRNTPNSDSDESEFVVKNVSMLHI